MKNKKNSAAIAVIITLLSIAILAGLIMIIAGSATSPVLIATGIILLILGCIILITSIAVFNKIVRYKNKIAESLALIDIHLKLRFDLIPNLVNTVKGYIKHEEKVLAETIALRNKCVKTEDEKEKIETANQLIPKMHHVFVLAEDYPKLKADALFKTLMEEVVEIEDKIVASRRIYDSNVNLYNSLIQVFPNNIVAKLHNFNAAELLKIDTGEKIIPQISFNKD